MGGEFRAPVPAARILPNPSDIIPGHPAGVSAVMIL